MLLKPKFYVVHPTSAIAKRCCSSLSRQLSLTYFSLKIYASSFCTQAGQGVSVLSKDSSAVQNWADSSSATARIATSYRVAKENCWAIAPCFCFDSITTLGNQQASGRRHNKTAFKNIGLSRFLKAVRRCEIKSSSAWLSRPCLIVGLENQGCDRPFIDKVPQLYTTYSVSTILVIGESGDQFDLTLTCLQAR